MADLIFTSLCAERGCPHLWCRVQGAFPCKRTASTADSAMPGQRPSWNLHKKANSLLSAVLPHTYCRLRAPSAEEIKDLILARTREHVTGAEAGSCPQMRLSLLS
jgi:hypothetical protein